MGRKKIQIKLIKNDRLRNVNLPTTQITYNKRKRGLLKKMVQLSVMCGIKAKLEIKDCFGNLIVLNAGQNEAALEEKPKDRMLVFTPADVNISKTQYPEFKGFDKIRRKAQANENDEASSDIKEPLSLQDKEVQKENEPKTCSQLQSTSQLGFQQVVRKPEEPVRTEEIPVMNIPVADSSVSYMNQLATIQNIHLQTELQYAQLRYQALLSSFITGGHL